MSIKAYTSNYAFEILLVCVLFAFLPNAVVRGLVLCSKEEIITVTQRKGASLVWFVVRNHVRAEFCGLRCRICCSGNKMLHDMLTS